jgi:quinoprotein glucose dehydrogenase
VCLLGLALVLAPRWMSIEAVSQRPSSAPPMASHDWGMYYGDDTRSHYSSLDQITKMNVSQLRVAWSYDTGDRGEFEANPIVVDGVLYIPTHTRKVVALDAASGRQLWRFDSTRIRPGGETTRQRGVTYWADGADRRVYTTVGPYLYALNARTGEPVRSFGQNGSVHMGLAAQEDRPSPPEVQANAPGVIYKDLIIVGVMRGTAGNMQAYDVRTGALRWLWWGVPRPGEYGYLSWPPDAYRVADGANQWSGAALDSARGIIYVPTSQIRNSTFWGGERLGANLFANSLVALDANTGKHIWHFQGVHHDLLDRDIASTPPVLLTVTHNGRKVDIVAQGSKVGFLYVFERFTGEPLWPIFERPVPPSTLPGEQAWPTQPFPSRPEPLMRINYTVDEVSNISPESRASTLSRFKEMVSDGPYPAPSFKETIVFPGFDGGMEWGGPAVDERGNYYVNLNEVPWILQMIASHRVDGTSMTPGERAYAIQCSACHQMNRRGDSGAGIPSLVNIGDRLNKEQVSELIRLGGTRMPPFASLQSDSLESIVAYLFDDEEAQPTVGGGSQVAIGQPGGRIGGSGGFGGTPWGSFTWRRWVDEDGYPAIRPPWGTLNAVDLNTGELKWKVPLGEYPELTAKGIPITGRENYGGPVTTASGLVFIAATADEMFRAFDSENGELLWQTKLPYSGFATPATYMVNGKQYVVIAAGGGKLGRPPGGSVIAFALP